MDLCLETNYEGYVAWGEYPFAFAACLSQEECYRYERGRGSATGTREGSATGTIVRECYRYEGQFSWRID